MYVYDDVIRMLVDTGVEDIFTLLSEDTMSITGALEAEWDDVIRPIQSRHEQSAVAMADGYSRTTEGFGVCIVGRGPAIAQTGTALVTARKNASDVLVIALEPALSSAGDIKDFDQIEYLHSTIGNVTSLRDPDVVLSEFRNVLREVRVGDGPLAVQIPWDVFEADIDSTTEPQLPLTTDRTQRSRLKPPGDLISEAVEVYLDSDATEPPIVLAGRGAVRSDAGDAIEAVAARTNALIATTLQARGYLSDHPYNLGLVGEWGSAFANEQLHNSGCIFAVGSSLNPHTTDSGELLRDDANLIHIDTDAPLMGSHEQVDLAIEADGRSALELMVEELDRRDIDRGQTLWTDRLRGRIAEASVADNREFEQHDNRVDPRELASRLDTILPTNRIVVTDGGHFTRWVIDYIETPDPGSFIWTIDFGSIGLGLPMGIGTAVAASDRTCLAVCGDTGFMMSLQELDTAVRNDIPLIVVVMNDSASGIEYHNMLKSGEHADVAVLSTPNIAEIAESFGAEGYRIESMEELDQISHRFTHPPDGPLLLDCRINRDVLHRTVL
jgi:thiamine pyrophosphate-dependent acetolactate synthase large subunit-like protein